MKNHIAVKFIAVLLCAASLLGAVGSGMGVFLMTEMDLYDKTVDQVYQEYIENDGRNLANKVAMRYTSTTLGGTPADMLEEYFGYGDAISSSGFDPWYVGYSLKDADGNELDGRDLNAPLGFSTYSFDITGQYMHFVDAVPVSERQAEEAAREDAPTMMGEADAVKVDAVPPEGAVVYEYQLSTTGSSVGASGWSGAIVFRNQEGQVIFRDPGLSVDPEMENELVTSLHLLGEDGQVIFDASSESGIGVLQCDPEMGVTFSSYPITMPMTAAAEAEIVEETIPETSLPEETVIATEAEETAPAETEAEAATEAENEENATEATASEDPEEATEATAAQETQAATEPSAPAETEAEAAADPTEVTEASSDAEAVAAKADSEAEPAADGTEATEETAAPTVAETIPEETVPEETFVMEPVPEKTMINGKPLESYQVNRTDYYDSTLGETVTARFVYLPMPEMTLELYVQPGALRSESSFTLMRIVRSISGQLFPAMGICLLIFAITLVYLFCSAGKTPGSEEIRAGGLNRIPLDLYGFCGLGAVVGLCAAIAEGGDYVLRQNVNVGIAFMAAMGFLAALVVVGFLFACAAQFRMPGGFWWRNSLCGLCLKLCLWACKLILRICVRLEAWAEAKGWPLLKRLCKWLWNLVCAVWKWFWNLVKKGYQKLYSAFSHFYDLLPMTWQWIVTGGVMVLFLFITLAGRYDLGIVLAVLFAFALVLYGAHCFGSLMEATRKMNRGDLNSKADDKLMIGAFKDFAHDLNDLADVAVVAAQKQLKSERMKTELITNVSHDIKTPLTSIINYVDLLQKPHTEEEQEQYLEVLDRQSQRLKKLIDDLMDMSKASTGNMAVDITLVDAVESVNQALGEFGDKLERAQLTPVFRHTEPTVAMMADGKLVWRVLSNLLSNAVKYAMPGTRLYIDLMSLENKVVISLKNISREELNVDAEELMERFVRGDDARNTEGSGLGLNIAKSLMELQKGQLQLLVDGDLFKVTLIFPGV